MIDVTVKVPEDRVPEFYVIFGQWLNGAPAPAMPLVGRNALTPDDRPAWTDDDVDVARNVWNKLSAAQKAKYAAVGKRTKIAPKKKAPLNKWQKFVKTNYKSVKKLPFKKRVAAIAKKWNKN